MMPSVAWLYGGEKLTSAVVGERRCQLCPDAAGYLRIDIFIIEQTHLDRTSGAAIWHSEHRVIRISRIILYRRYTGGFGSSITACPAQTVIAVAVTVDECCRGSQGPKRLPFAIVLMDSCYAKKSDGGELKDSVHYCPLRDRPSEDR